MKDEQGEWAVLTINDDAEGLRQNGPNVSVTLEAIPQLSGQPTMKVERLTGLIDTGSTHSLVKKSLIASRFNGFPLWQTGNIDSLSGLGGISEKVPMFKFKFSYEDFELGGSFLHDFAVPENLDGKHDVIIGCDLLLNSRLNIDFTTGKWGLQIKIR